MTKHPYASFVHTVEKPARYLGGEYLSIQKDWQATPVKIALAFPDLYEIGMSHLGMKILYSVLNKQEDLLAERVYTPWTDMEAKLREHQLPLLSLESQQPLGAFDVVGFSLQYEMTYTNVLTMLDLGHIPFKTTERDLSYPLIVAGGPCAVNPEPMAAFIDAFVVGDGEEVFSAMARIYTRMRQAGADKTAILIELAKLGGVYCPALYATRVEDSTDFIVVERPLYPDVPAIVERTTVGDINQYPFPGDSPVPNIEAIFDRTSIEIARGCTEGCRFCQAGMIYRPVRERSPEQIIDAVLKGVNKAGYDESGLTSLSTADFSCVSPLVKELMKRLKAEKVSLSVSSLRAYGLSGDLLDEIADVRNTSLTFAPEAGTQRMRDVVNKNISEADLAKSAHNIFSRGWRKMKLYFMIGLPTETDEDVAGICETGSRMLEIAKLYHKRWKMVNITVSVSSFVPKPHTPFQWSQMSSIGEIERKQALCQQLARKYFLGIKWHDSRISFIEAFMSRGDRRMGPVIEAMWHKGARFDGWGQCLDFDGWMATLTELLPDLNIYLRTIPLDSQLPWGHISVGLEPDFNKKEYQKALKDRLSPPCGKPFRAKVHHTNLTEAQADQRKLICYDCGVSCDLQQMRDERLIFLEQLHAIEPPPPVPELNLETGEPLPMRVPKLEKFEQAGPFIYRGWFTKLARTRFVSHTDLVRLMPRILRRSGFEMFYSQGYHPLPIMTFSPALSLGVSSFGEVLDFQLAEEPTPEELLARMNQHGPEGVQFTRIEKVALGDKGLGKLINGGTYLVALAPETVDTLLDATDRDRLAILQQRIDALMSAPAFVVTRQRKERIREVDIRPMLATLTLPDLSAIQAYLDKLDWEPDQICLLMHLQIAGEDGLKPAEVLKALFSHDEFYYECARLDVGTYQPVAVRALETAGV